MDVGNIHEKLLRMDGAEEWMNQFVIDPFYNGNIDGIRLELFETESSFIVEAILPGFQKGNILINIVLGGIQLHLTSTEKEESLFIKLPFSLCKKKISATLGHDLLEILIYKEKERKTPNYFRTIKIKE